MSEGDSSGLPPLQQTNGNREAAGVASSVCSVSTAPSTDEASSLGPEWTQYSNETNARLMQHQPSFHHQQQLQQQQHHRRVPSWDISSPNSQLAPAGGSSSPTAMDLPPSFSPSGWPSTVQQQQQQRHQQQHVASFRGELHQNQGYAQAVRMNSQWHQPNLPFLPSSMGRGIQDSSRGMFHRQNNAMPYPFPLPHQRKPQSQPPLPPSAHTPPRSGINERGGRVVPRVVVSSQVSHRPPQSQTSTPVGGGGSRSSSEVLKTLLRKKACLYEPDTSRAVALVTWLVGRELALEYGFFSRQQLQAGVHACVADKINAGIITRTKVNRCMQIILNSCFHYIIPRSDGTEESGEAFRNLFAEEMKDNTFLLSVLPHPWHDIGILRHEILAACEEDEVEQRTPKKYTFETPCASPRLGSLTEKVPSSPGRDSVDGDSECKRAVLLCFNENVRCAEDVFRCHNEFIRDTAHSCHLQLSSSEWRLFFGREAAGARYLWGNVGIPVPFLDGQGPQQTDALGVLTNEELGVFRTSWCSKRYDHDHELCGFGHAEVNGGWLRRSTFIHNYSDEMCRFVSTAPASARPESRNVIVVNECPHGLNCGFAHSLEEIAYHQNRYKRRTCSSIGRAGGCNFGDVCPCFHPVDSYRFPKKSDGRSPRHTRSGQLQANSGGKGAASSIPPNGSPILYSNPAPVSSFEQHLVLPGLQSLFRRHSKVVRANLPSSSHKAMCYYSCFEPSSNGQSSPHQSQSIGPPQQSRT
jgi:hypothetical protein